MAAATATSRETDASHQEDSRAIKNLVQQLIMIVDNGTLSQLQSILQVKNLKVNGCNKHGERALHVAAGYGRMDFVKELHKAGAKLDCQDKNGDTPLYWASRHGHSEVVRYLCDSGEVDVDHQDMLGETAVLVATRYAQPGVLTVLQSFNANLNLQDKEGECPLLCACWHGHQGIVEQLLAQSGCSLSIRNLNRETALHLTAVRGFYSILRLLCEHGAELNPMNIDGHTPLLLATKRNHLDIVQYLCEQERCDVNIQNLEGDTALHEACREGNISLVYTLCAAGSDLDVPNNRGQTPVYLAAMKGHTEIVRYLCAAGCSLDTTSSSSSSIKDDDTLDRAAERAGHTQLADMLLVLRQGDMRERCLQELSLEGGTQVDRVRLLFCGAAGVGKSTLISTLRTKFLRSIRRPTFGGSYLGSLSLESTYGFCVQKLSLPNAGEFSVWDFSGQKEYYPIHEYFLDCRNGIYVIMYKSIDSFEVQLAQVRFWLAMIKSKHKPDSFIHYAGHYNHKPYIILVSSFHDRPLDRIAPSLSNGSGFEEEDDFVATSPLANHTKPRLPPLHHRPHQSIKDNSSVDKKHVLDHVAREFGDHFNFTDSVFQLDTRQPRGREVRRMRSLIGSLRVKILKQQAVVPLLFNTLQEVLPEWRREMLNFPVMTWNGFFTMVKDRINPLVSEDRLQIVTNALMDVGEIIHIREGCLSNVVILEADWLGQRIFGPSLAPENSPILKLRSMTGRIPLGEVRRVYPELDPLSVVHLLEYFGLCRSIGNEAAYEFPSLIKMEPLYGIWERDPELTVYSGVQIRCTSACSIFSPSLFPRTQLQIRKMFADDIEDQELILWKDGLKCSRGEVEICVRQVVPNWNIEVIVRGTEHTRTESYALLQQFYTIVVSTIHLSNPGTVFTTEVLSMRSLLDHVRQPHLYSSIEIFEAERSSSSMLAPPTADLAPESLCDLLCCGWKEGEVSAKCAPYTSIRDVPLQTRVQICRMMDPPHPFGRDWCLLALQLGLQEEVAAIDGSLDRGSPTDKLLTVWDYASRQTIVSLVDALKSIGREDVALELVNGLSPFCNPNNSLVMNVSGVVSTSYFV